jgi:hypothetical protein
MAQKNRANLQIVIDTNLPDNTTDLITPVKHREVEEDLKDSNYNKLDDTAFDVNYTPTTPADWGATVPTETGGGLDILIKKVATNAPLTTAYVSETGSDTINEFEIGNPLKPFLTILAALNAVGDNGKVIVTPGTYAGFTKFSMLNVTIDLQGSIITSGGIFCPNGSGLTFILSKTQITGNVRIDGARVEGGIINGDSSFFGCAVEDVLVNSSGTGFIGENSKLTNLIVISVGDGIKATSNCRFYGCYVQTTGANAPAYRHGALGSPVNKFYDTQLISDQFITLFHNTSNFSVMMWNCRIYSAVNNNLNFPTESENIYFKGCAFVTLASAPNILVTTLNNTTIQQPTFEECRFITQGTGVLDEGTYAGGDLTDWVFNNCIINKATITSVAPQKVSENNTYSKLDLIDIN